VASRGVDSNNLSTLSFGLTSATSAARRDFDAALVLNIANGFYLPWLRLHGIPCAVNTDGIEWEREKWSAMARAVFRLGAQMTARFANTLVADSRVIGDVWKARYHVDSVFIPYGAHVRNENRHTRLAPLHLKRDRYLLVVARLIPENNVELIVEAARGVCTPDRPLVVVGSANSESALERHLLERQHDGTVVWLGHVSDQELLAQLWAHCAIYLHGHSVGGTNPALLQALGAGAPTLALDTRFNREVVQLESHLFPHSAQALRARLRQLLDDADARQELRANGQEVVRTRYRWDDVCARYESVLTALSATRRRPT